MIVRPGEYDLQITVPPDAHTLDGFRRWVRSGDFPERGRISLIDGKLVIDMRPERSESHNAVKMEISRVLGTLVRDNDLGKFYPDGMWITNDDAAVSNEPDAIFAAWRSFEEGRFELVLDEGVDDGIELRGTPDWALEVVSPTSVRKDTQWLLAAYFQAGVREYWLVDAREGPLQFTLFTRGREGFVPVASQEGWLASEVFDREFRLERQRDRLGGCRYTLHLRPRHIEPG